MLDNPLLPAHLDFVKGLIHGKRPSHQSEFCSMSMRTPFIIVLFALACLTPSVKAEESPISVSIAIPSERYGGRILYYRDKSTHFHVIVSNTSDKPRRIWREQCSWGYFGLTFEFTDDRGKKWTANKKQIPWRRNFPDWWILEPHESFVLDVYFGDPAIWEGFPNVGENPQTVTIRAVFEFKPDDESLKNGIWTGRVVSKSDRFTFHPSDKKQAKI